MTMAAGPVAGPTSVRRAGNQVDVLSIVMAALAVIALVISSVIAWVVVSSSSPEGDALRTLTQSQAVLTNDTQAVNASISRLDEARAASIAYAQQLQLPLEQLAGMSDDAALATAESARAAYLSALEILLVPPAVDAFTPPAIDEESLPSIGAAIPERREARTSSERAGRRISRKCAHPTSAQKSTEPKARRSTPADAMARAFASPFALSISAITGTPPSADRTKATVAASSALGRIAAAGASAVTAATSAS